MQYVIDSSVAFKWHVPEDDSDKALRIRDDFLAGAAELLTPDIFPLEIAHALTRAERQGRISITDGAIHLQDTLATLPRLAASLLLLPRAYQISSAERIGVYDCLYVALAEREGCALLTADTRLISNLQSNFPFITALSQLP